MSVQMTSTLMTSVFHVVKNNVNNNNPKSCKPMHGSYSMSTNLLLLLLMLTGS